MKRKGMRTRKIVIGTLTVAIMASQLCGCAAVTQSELVQMCREGQSITIEIAEPVSIEQGGEVQGTWEYLAYLGTYMDFRLDVDDILYVTKQGEKGKNGVIYVSQDGSHTDNATLYMAFQNEKFVEGYWKDSAVRGKLAEAAESVYVDVGTASQALLSMVNGYWNLLDDGSGGYANLQRTLSRGEFLAFLLKADTPVHGEVGSTEFAEAVGGGEYAAYAGEVADACSYLGIGDRSLDSETFNGTVTRAEAVYALVKRYYREEYEGVAGSESVSYTDAKNGGDIALKAGFSTETKDKGTKETIRTDPQYRYNSYELAYAIQNPDGGMPEGLYKALVVADRHGLLPGDESRWDEGLTKGEALEMLITVYERLGEENGYAVCADRGQSRGITSELASSTAQPEETAQPATENKGLDRPITELFTYDDETGTVDIDPLLQDYMLAKDREIHHIDNSSGYFHDVVVSDLNAMLMAYSTGVISEEQLQYYIDTGNYPEGYYTSGGVLVAIDNTPATSAAPAQQAPSLSGNTNQQTQQASDATDPAICIDGSNEYVGDWTQDEALRANIEAQGGHLGTHEEAAAIVAGRTEEDDERAANASMH